MPQTQGPNTSGSSSFVDCLTYEEEWLRNRPLRQERRRDWRRLRGGTAPQKASHLRGPATTRPKPNKGKALVRSNISSCVHRTKCKCAACLLARDIKQAVSTGCRRRDLSARLNVPKHASSTEALSCVRSLHAARARACLPYTARTPCETNCC